MTIAILLVSFSILLLIGVPIAWCMGVASLLAIYLGHLNLPAAWFAQQTIRGADAITLAAIPLFLFGTVLYLFFATGLGLFLGTVARSMPQLGLLYMLIAVPMNVLSGAATPLESMPPWLATVMQASPSTHFVSFAQAILYRGAGLDVVWPQFLAVAGIGALFLALSLLRFRAALAPA